MTTRSSADALRREATIAVTVAEAADLTSLARSTVYRLMASGRLPYAKIGRARRIRVADLQALIDSALEWGV